MCVFARSDRSAADHSPLCAADSWHIIQKEQAKARPSGLTHWEAIRRLAATLDWVSGEMKTHYAINLNIVHSADAADANGFRQKLPPGVRPSSVIFCGLTRISRR